MKSNAWKVILPFIIIIGAVVLMVGLIASKKPPEKKPETEQAFLVGTQPVEYQDVQFEVISQGTLLPVTESNLVAQVSGVVINVSDVFIEGGFFEQGDVLVELERADYETDLKLAEAELQRAKAALEEEIARGKVAAEEWRTVKTTVPTELGLRKPQLAAAQASMRAAEAQLERAQRNLARTRIKAPFDGLVLSKSVDLGQFVGTGTVLGRIYATQKGQIRLPLSDKEIGQLGLQAADKPLSVELNANVGGKPQQWQAQIVRNEGVFDQTSRVIYVVAELNDPYARAPQTQHSPVKFGRFLRADIEGQTLQNVVRLPRHLLRIDGSVLVTNAQRELEIRQVDVARTDENYAYISGGLNADDLVITTAVPNPFDGMKLRFIGDESAEADANDEAGE